MHAWECTRCTVRKAPRRYGRDVKECPVCHLPQAQGQPIPDLPTAATQPQGGRRSIWRRRDSRPFLPPQLPTHAASVGNVPSPNRLHPLPNQHSQARRHSPKGILLITALALVAMSFVYWAPHGTATKGHDATALYETWSPSVVSVISESGSGTGFVCSGGRIATCLHCVAGEGQIVVTRPDGYHAVVESVAWWDPQHDLALLNLTQQSPAADEPIAAIRKTQKHPAIGSPIFVIGDPFGLTHCFTTGLLSNVFWKDGVPSQYVISAPAAVGSSGSPVFDEAGNVIAVVTSGIGLRGQAGSIHLCAPISYLRESDNDQRMPLRKWKAFSARFTSRSAKAHVPPQAPMEQPQSPGNPPETSGERPGESGAVSSSPGETASQAQTQDGTGAEPSPGAPLDASAPLPLQPPPQQAPSAGDAWVWVNTNWRSGLYFFPGDRWYGNTRQGEYMSERDALSRGYTPAYHRQPRVETRAMP